MKRYLILLALLLAPGILQAQDFRHRYFHYDQIYTDPDNIFLIKASTIDGADNKYIRICGGGEAGESRGSNIILGGNESVIAGQMQLHAAGTAGILAFTNSGSGNVTRVTIPYLADAEDADLVFGTVSTTAPVFTIRGQTADGDDDGNMCLTPGGSCAPARAPRIYMYGNENAAGRGQLTLAAGDDAAAGLISLETGNGFIQWQIPRQTGATAVSLEFGANAANTVIAQIASNRDTDGTDDDTLSITAAGTAAPSRGSYISLYGNEVTGNNGRLILAAGDDVNSGTIQFKTGNAFQQWTMPRQTAATAVDLTFGDSGASNAVIASIFSARNTDGTDDDILRFGAGGAVSTGRGATIQLYGNEVGGGDSGRLVLSAGEVTDGKVELSAGGIRWTVPRFVSTKTSDFAFGTSGESAVVATIRGNRADGSDDGLLSLTGGGAVGVTRGAYINLSGNEATATGAVVASTGDNASAYFQSAFKSRFEFSDLDAKGATFNVKHVTEEITMPVGQDQIATAGDICPSGIILGVTARVTDAPGGGATTFDVGCQDSGNLDQFIDGKSTALNTTGTYPVDGDGTNTSWVQKLDDRMTVTADAAVTGDSMKIRISTYYIDNTAPTS